MATSGFSSTFSLAIVSFPLCSSATSSSTGEIILQGPHHSAQKSTSTGVLAWSTSVSNVASVTALALLIPVGAFGVGDPSAPPPPRPRDLWWHGPPVHPTPLSTASGHPLFLGCPGDRLPNHPALLPV